MSQPTSSLADLFPLASNIPADYAAVLPVETREYLVDGELRRWTGPVEDIVSPILVREDAGLVPVRLGSCPVLGAEEGREALAAACRAFGRGRGHWPTLGVAGRIAAVEDFARRLAERREVIVRLMSWEIGKSLEGSSVEFDRTVEYLRDTVDALRELESASSGPTAEGGILGRIRRTPLGVALCMGPFNYPLNETFATLIPALIMGNTVIMKTPKLGRLLFAPLMECFRDSFPAGVINVISGGRDMLAPIMASGQVNVLAFIGTSRAAGALRGLHPKPHRLRCVLGMEAKNAAIVLPDADLELTVAECVRGALGFNGQRCTALKMLFVAREREAEFLERFLAGVAQLSVGMPWRAGVNITPLPEPGKVPYLRALVEDALAQGAAIANPGGGAYCETLFAPTVLSGVLPGMRIAREEQFGPLVPIAAYDDIEEPLEYIAQSDYGQQVSLFGTDPDQLGALIDPLINQVCRVNLNTKCQRGPDSFPFTGRKDSAEGTLSVTDALRAFSIRTLVAARDTASGQDLFASLRRPGVSSFLSDESVR